MPTPTTADQATLVYTAAGDLLSDYADLVELLNKYDPNHKLKNKIEGPVRKALIIVSDKLITARMQVQLAISMAATQLKIPKEDLHDWRQYDTEAGGDQD